MAGYTSMDDISLIEAGKSGDSDAAFTLWNRYKGFTAGFYNKGVKTIYSKLRLSEEDFTQDAYIEAFTVALNSADVTKMKNTGCTRFSTVYWFRLMKLEYKYINQLKESNGPVYCQSDFIEPSYDADLDEYSNEWTKATSGMLAEDEFSKAMAQKTVSEYFLSEGDATNKNIFTLLLMGNNLNQIKCELGIQTYYEVKKRTAAIYETLRAMALKNAFI